MKNITLENTFVNFSNKINTMTIFFKLLYF